MVVDLTPPPEVEGWKTPGARPRMVVDARGTEWEVYDEGEWSLELALEWEFLPQTKAPGLSFSSREGRRRVWPCPDDWRRLGDRQLLDLLEHATTRL